MLLDILPADLLKTVMQNAEYLVLAVAALELLGASSVLARLLGVLESGRLPGSRSVHPRLSSGGLAVVLGGLRCGSYALLLSMLPVGCGCCCGGDCAVWPCAPALPTRTRVRR